MDCNELFWGRMIWQNIKRAFHIIAGFDGLKIDEKIFNLGKSIYYMTDLMMQAIHDKTSSLSSSTTILKYFLQSGADYSTKVTLKD